MYKDFVNVTPESGGAGTTPIAVAADENEGAARSTSLNIAGGGVTLTWLQIQYSDEIGQKPYAISVRGGFTGVSELNTVLWSGKFQNGVINATYQAQFKIDGVIRNFKWRIQGAHI